MRTFWALVLLVFTAAAGGCASGGPKAPAAIVAEGCREDIATYCADVSKGEGRVLACLYAFSDRISSRCEYALYEAAAQLQRSVDALTYAANECRDDLKTYCSGVTPGEGHVLQCLQKNRDKVSDRCRLAQKEIGLK